MKDFFKELFDYGHHYNQQLAGIFTANAGQASEKSVRLFSHILDAHQIWNNRITPVHPPFAVWQLHPIGAFAEIDKTNYHHTLLLLDMPDLNAPFCYTNTRGQSFTNNVRDILFHVINHSTYHRAQIATEFRESGLEPLPTDYILYKR